jgi:SAM-dependent methyltransferase
MAFDALLSQMAEKWRELPGGTDQQPRQFSDQILQDINFATAWQAQYDSAATHRGWYWYLYGEILRGKKVLEIGSGQGFDAVRLASCGASLTCCDIAPSNLEIVRRIAKARGLEIETVHIDGLHAFDRLSRDFDAVWAIGSIHHVPFDEAREESAAIIEHLKPGGRWIELGYPRERWVREGSPPFHQWGRLTDGERTPWVEWYDVEKLKLRLYPWRVEPILEHRLQSDTYVWMDCRVVGKGDALPIARAMVPVPAESLVADVPIWNYAWSMPLGPSPAGAAITVDVECVVGKGSVGFVLWRDRDNHFVSREVIVEVRTGSQRLSLSTTAYDVGVRLLARNASALGASEWRISSIEISQTL